MKAVPLLLKLCFEPRINEDEQGQERGTGSNS